MSIEVRISLDSVDKSQWMEAKLFVKRTVGAILRDNGINWHTLSIGADYTISYKADGIHDRQWRLAEADRAVLQKWIEDYDGSLNPNPIRNRKATFEEWDVTGMDDDGVLIG